MNIGDIVKVELNGEWQEGTITNIYAVPKDYDLIDVDVNGEKVTVKTDEVLF